MRRLDFKNIGAASDILLPGLVTKLKTAVANFDRTTATPWHKNLAGNLTEEYYWKDCWDEVEEIVLRLAKFHEEQYQCFNLLVTDTNKRDLKINSMWINVQHKHEFNPMHTHDGVYSFVIWLTMPYSMKNEAIVAPGSKSNTNRAGYFEFVYTNSLGQVMAHPIPIDNAFDGTICLFPAKLNHAVYPFYSSDGERITIAGNVVNY
jgi:hypothetical protein